MTKNTLIALVLIISVLLPGCSSKPEPKPEPPKPPAPSTSFVPAGGIAKLKKNTIIAANDAAYEELVKFAMAGNQEAIARMAMNRRVALIDAGIRVTVIKNGFERSYVEVMDGDDAGYRGWLLISSLQ